MFWRFGLNNVSTLDTLLDKEDVSLELILDEDDLLQECKSQNTRLIDYFQRVDVLQRLFAYVSGQIEGEDSGRFKYPHVATEVLCSELWCIVETCMNEQDRILAPFWETVLDMSPEEMKTRTTMGGHFAKINAVFMTKKPTEMLTFIKSQPGVVERILQHIETSAFVDLLIRMIQLDEQPGGAGVLEWLGAENLMGRLVDLLSPSHPSEIHSIVSELIKGIISMATPSPGAENMYNSFASNMFARNLANRQSINTLVEYITHPFGPCDIWPLEQEGVQDMLSNTSSVINSISVFTELIRKNNSDYFEPYIFHLLRQRLIQVAQQVPSDSETAREVLEQSMKEVVDRMGVVHLGHLLEQMTEHLGILQGYLKNPRSAKGLISTTAGSLVPLTFERFRICELLAELLHCSNMSLLNRSCEYEHLYNEEGCLQGGLTGLEELGNAISANPVRSNESTEQVDDEMEPALELPVTGSSHSSSVLDSDEDMDEPEPGSSDDEVMEEIEMFDDPASPSETPPNDSLHIHAHMASSSPSSFITHSPDSAKEQLLAQENSDSDISTLGRQSRASRRSTRKNTVDSVFSPIRQFLPTGERLKRRFIDLNVLGTLLDLFFEYRWNNFLHSSVYDIVHQILVGVVDTGLNRELVLSLFRDARLMPRIVEGVKLNEAEQFKPKGLRLGYMGHLTLMSEDIVNHLERFPSDLRAAIMQHAPIPEWEEYVNGEYGKTKSKNETPLGGGKPVASQPPAKSTVQWKQDDHFSSLGTRDTAASTNVSGTKGEFRRTTSARPTRESSADFGPPDMEDADEGHTSPQFARYLAQEMQTTSQFSSGSDDDDDEGGWLSRSTNFEPRSTTFTLADPPLSVRPADRRPLSSGFDDIFDPHNTLNNSENPFNGGDTDAFGPFADSTSFSFPTSFSADDMDESFDFGDFQSGGDSSGELTPTTTGSWTFESVLVDETGLDGSVKNLDLNTRSEEGTQTESGRLSPIN